MTDDDVLDLLRRYAPSANSVSGWTQDQERQVLADITGVSGGLGSPSHDIPLRFRPAPTYTPRWRRVLPGATSAALVAAAAVVLVTQLGRGGDAPAAAGHGPVFVPPTRLADTALTHGEVSYRVVRQIDLAPDGTVDVRGKDALLNRSWITAHGDITSERTGSQTGCLSFTRRNRPSFEEPTQRFFASLPTDVAGLQRYLRGHVQGSSSHDEAVFVAVGDALRTADGLASPRLRAAMIAVLSRTPGVFLHRDARDYLGRPALRLDFVDQAIRPGGVHAYFFSPRTYQFLEESFSENGQPTAFPSASPAYDSPAPSTGDDPAALTGTSYVEVMIAEKTVAADQVPSCG
jgi:hypothetical protein